MTEGVVTTGAIDGQVIDRKPTFDEAHLLASKIADRGMDSSICRDVFASPRGPELGAFAVLVRPGGES